MRLSHLRSISKTCHATSYSKNIVVGCIGIQLHITARREGELEGRVINTGHVNRPRWLMLFGLKSKTVDVDTSCWATGMALVWLNQVEVRSKTS